MNRIYLRDIYLCAAEVLFEKTHGYCCIAIEYGAKRKLHTEFDFREAVKHLFEWFDPENYDCISNTIWDEDGEEDTEARIYALLLLSEIYKNSRKDYAQ